MCLAEAAALSNLAAPLQLPRRRQPGEISPPAVSPAKEQLAEPAIGYPCCRGWQAEATEKEPRRRPAVEIPREQHRNRKPDANEGLREGFVIYFLSFLGDLFIANVQR